MALLRSPAAILATLAVFLLISPSISLKCTSQKFTNNKLYSNCADLPTLSAYLHWTYNSTKSSLSVAFIAPPAKPDGWISWAINPNGTGMAGAQALVAFKQPNGSVTVKTFNISSYKLIVPEKLSFEVSDLSAEFSGGEFRIFATVAVPAKKTSLNQVWQVGPSVTNGRIDKHDFDPASLNSKGVLDLVKGGSGGGGGGAPAVPPVPAASPRKDNSTAGGPSGSEKSAAVAAAAGISMLGLYVMVFVAASFTCL